MLRNVLCLCLVFCGAQGYELIFPNGSSNIKYLTFNNQPHCRYRNYPALVPLDLWHYVTAGYCYFYTIPSRRQASFLDIAQMNWPSTEVIVPVLVVGENKYMLFDYKNETFVNEIIAPTFKIQLYVDQWLECTETGMECCNRFDYDEDYNIQPTDDFPCPALWDGWACWRSAAAGTVLSQECPIYSFTSGERLCQLQSHKTCQENGTWVTKTNNAGCAVAPIYRRRHNFHIIVLYVSTALTVPAIILYFSFSKLRSAKDWETFNLPLYRNLLICVVIKNILTIISKEVVILASLDINETDTYLTVMEANGVGCRILAFVENLSKNAIFTCMLVVGYFLHKSIARIFANGKTIKMYLLYLGILGISLIPSLSWAIVMAIFTNDHCWMVDQNGYQWITDSYKFFILAVNLLLLIDIVRVLTTGRVKTDSKTVKSAVKATLFLIPLFGVPLLLTGQRSLFDTDSCSDVYYFVGYIIEGSQGVVVALLFCYLNKRVHNEMKKSYRDFAINMEQRFNVKLWRPTEENRKTATTNVRSTSSTTQRPQNQWESFS